MEQHSKIFGKLFDRNNSEVTFPTHGKVVKIENVNGQALMGVLVDKSIAIPLSASNETEYYLKIIAQSNLVGLDRKPGESTPEAACHLMGLPYNGHTEGIYSDGIAIGNISTIHIHPRDFFETQEDFLSRFTEVFESRGLKITVSESL